MKNKLVSIVSVFALLAFFVSSAVAQTGIPGSGWWTGEVIQNVGGTTANVVVTAYAKDGTVTYNATQTISSGASVTVLPNNFSGMTAGFIGSAVVSSDQPIKAVVNVTNVYNGTFGVVGGKGQALYQGTETVDTALYFPMVKNNRYGASTAFYIQNAGTTAASVTAVFKMDTGTPGVYTYTVASLEPNKMAVINPSDAGVPSTAGAGRDNIGSLKVSSAQNLAGTVLEYKQGETIATVLKGTRGFTAADFSTKAYAPTTKNARYGHFTGIQVQNAGSSAIDITITYVGTAGTCTGNTYVDSATGVVASKTFNQLTGQTNLPANCIASATITATGNIIATVNEDNIAPAPTTGTTYSAIPDSSKTAKVSVPQFKDRRYSATTGLRIQNVGTATATNIVATFSCRGGATFTAISNPQTVVAGGAVQFYQPANTPAMFTTTNPFSAQNVICGVTITSDQPIVAIANEADPNVSFDDNNYEGFNLTP